LSILQAQQISCEKQDRILFQDIELSIDNGELLMLRGENGAGKTSLLRILVGLSTPISGQILINNQDLRSDINIATAGIVYVGHKLGLSGLLSPIENLQFYLSTIGHSSSTHTLHDYEPTNANNGASKILEVLTLLGLEGFEDLPLKHLSAGQQRRVSLAKLWLNQHANLWVLDEPFTALDVGTVSLLERKIEHFLASGGGVIMTSHQSTSIAHKQRVYDLEYAW
jgi:heme exporter protein A